MLFCPYNIIINCTVYIYQYYLQIDFADEHGLVTVGTLPKAQKADAAIHKNRKWSTLNYYNMLVVYPRCGNSWYIPIEQPHCRSGRPVGFS